MLTVFDKPQFQLLPDYHGVRMYANVDNRMEVVRPSGVHIVTLSIPTGLFPLMQDVLKIPPEDLVTLSLDQLDEKYVFSLLQGSSTLVDLWNYTPKTLPAWILEKEYRTVTTTSSVKR